MLCHPVPDREETQEGKQMNLIDLDKVRWTDGFYDMLTGEQFAPMIFNTKEQIEWAIANAKVKAIPVEWLRELQVRYLKADCNMSVCVVNEILNLWEKENEKEIDRH